MAEWFENTFSLLGQWILSILPYALCVGCLIILLMYARRLQEATAQATPSRPPGMGDELEPAVLNHGLYSKIVLAVTAAGMACIFLAYALWDVMIWRWDWVGFNLGFPILIIPILYIALSIRGVGKSERGALYFYGIALKNVGPGPHLVFKFFMNLEMKPIDIQEIEEPGPRDKIFWGDEKEPLPSGMVRPIFVNSRSQIASVKTDDSPENAPLDVQMQYGVGYYVFWSVSSDVATFLQNSRTIDEASSQIKKLSLSLLDQIIGTRTTEGVIASQKNVNDDFVSSMCERAKGMGVRIHQAGLAGINLSHDMATAMRNRAKGQFELETRNLETAGQVKNIRDVGLANAEVARENAKAAIIGRSEGMKQIKEDLEVSGEAVLAHETLREGWPKSTVIAGAGNGTGDLIAAVKAAEAAFATGKGKGAAT